MPGDGTVMAPVSFASRWRIAVRRAGSAPFLLWEGADESVDSWSYEEFDRLVR
jgi:hypothetical protein